MKNNKIVYIIQKIMLFALLVFWTGLFMWSSMKHNEFSNWYIMGLIICYIVLLIIYDYIIRKYYENISNLKYCNICDGTGKILRNDKYGDNIEKCISCNGIGKK